MVRETVPEDALARVTQENTKLSHAYEAQVRQIELLREELSETNQGVVALYAELDNQAMALREATALKSRFLSYMSHEFRTPLGSIRSITRIMLDRMDGPLTIEQERQLKFIQGAAVELTEMVNDLLDLAKIEAGRISISPEWFEMVDLFAALKGIFNPLVKNAEVALILEEPDDFPKIFTDHKKLSQILRNFISNAIKFTERGEIRVLTQRPSDAMVAFLVADTGIGIAPEFHDAIFEDFVQVDSPIQKRWRGSGLGLSLSRKIARLLGGDVTVQSEAGVGSTFILTIRLRYEPETKDAAASAEQRVQEQPHAG